jgi:surface antigen
MRMISTVAIVLACAACQPYAHSMVVATAPGQPQSLQNEAAPDCREFSAPVTTAGRREEANGRACRQPDGTWRVAQNTPGLPTQEYLVPQPGQAPAGVSGNPQPPTDQTANPKPPANPTSCTTSTVPVSVGGQPQQATVEACPQPDGSWRIAQNTPGLPQQVYAIPAPAYSPYPYSYAYPADYVYPDFFPYWVGEPWFFGLAPSIVVVQRFHHFNHGFAHGFGHGFRRGFGHGFAGNFGHGFAAARGGGGGGGHR